MNEEAKKAFKEKLEAYKRDKLSEGLNLIEIIKERKRKNGNSFDEDIKKIRKRMKEVEEMTYIPKEKENGLDIGSLDDMSSY